MRPQLENIQLEIEKEFPSDPALQQVHLARKIISQEAESKGMNLFEFLIHEEKHLLVEADLEQK
ncbi:MAG: hypothetical protein HYZ34_01030 [Ignavibacteriae bacterium]|nr:hypothetical protein [Ignavibacteriota bacterium]